MEEAHQRSSFRFQHPPALLQAHPRDEDFHIQGSRPNTSLALQSQIPRPPRAKKEIPCRSQRDLRCSWTEQI